MSVTAGRTLIEALSAEHGIPVYVLHDFDISGFSIFGTLRESTDRFTYKTPPQVIDFGLRWADIDGLETEEVALKDDRAATRATLRRHGATAAEIDFIVPPRDRPCRRVELNAMTSDQFVAFVEAKLDEYGVAKVMPDADVLADAYHRARVQAVVQAEIDVLVRAATEAEKGAPVPADLRERLTQHLATDRSLSWDAALQKVLGDAHRS